MGYYIGFICDALCFGVAVWSWFRMTHTERRLDEVCAEVTFRMLRKRPIDHVRLLAIAKPDGEAARSIRADLRSMQLREGYDDLLALGAAEIANPRRDEAP